MRISIDTSGLVVPLSERLAAGFESTSLVFVGGSILSAIVLWQADGTHLRICSRTADIDPAEWLEIGQLIFDEDQAELVQLVREPLPADLLGPLSASKLVISASTASVPNVLVESGIVLRAQTNSELIIVASSFPYSIAIKASFVSRSFDAEYDLDAYAREPL